MSVIGSIGTSLPEYTMEQEEIKTLVEHIFPRPERELNRLLPVFENAAVEQRQFVVPKSWFSEQHSFVERNHIYQEEALRHSISAIDACLNNEDFLDRSIPYEAIDSIVFVSSTGIATPSLDAYIMNEREFRDDVRRIPLWGLGCAGGASGLARAHEWLTANPSRVCLVVSVELCSLTFQKDDDRKSNFIGTALFGDGIAAALLVGEDSPYQVYRKKAAPRITKVDSRIKKASLDVMGWEIADHGFEVIFAKSIPQIVKTFWKQHVLSFLEAQNTKENDYAFYVAHPGGKKVLQSIEEVLQISDKKLLHSYEVLKRHGNMSSATVFYILQKWMQDDIDPGERSLLSALGPGFSSELLELVWAS
ncbi:type III polyketide synthase [Sediminibacillus dalangtanensis]|uniref:Type III polyketide synthase n=1 Tax=Sediminibacillus dalangtanensis TaxID=2729421 RepID=A0ABX7VYB5_9BACI|nr:3-oxoacyl-[acyl-carrier-protein] synthase III C-terminal domain-containing protein [Sediminibacillus dalangtanensis]QTM99611.1 type III polyketide synthase [Sediminibacillus dalangtanensis]